MNQRILEIIDIIEKYFSKESFSFSEEVVEELLFEGFSENEIEEAMSWIETYQNEKDKMSVFEVNSKYNDVSLNKDAYDYLNSILNKKIISEADFDNLLNYCLFLADKDVDMLKLLQYHLTFDKLIEKWGKEARANYLAFSLKKDC